MFTLVDITLICGKIFFLVLFLVNLNKVIAGSPRAGKQHDPYKPMVNTK